MSEKIIYRERQISWMLLILMSVTTVALVAICFSEADNNTIGLFIFIPIIIIVLVTTMLFSTLTIQLTAKKIEAYFSFKIFRQELNIDEIDRDNIEVFTPNTL